MTLAPRTLRHLSVATLASVTLLTASAGLAAQAKRAPRAAAAPKPAMDAGIIPLPLTPIVSAGQRVCATRTPSGLGYTVLRAASGPKPAADATALVNYIGYLSATGAMFDQGMQTPMPVSGVIPGFSEGLQLLSRNAVIRLCIPAALGYGAQATGPIPANADLVFQIELLDFKTAAEIEALRNPPAATPAPPAAAQP